MKSLLISWISTVLAVATLTLLPNVSVTAPILILISATLIWLVLIVLWPVLKILLIPFNLASFGIIGSLVYLFLFWLCLWIFPGLSIQPMRIFGFYLGDMLILFFTAFILSALQNSYQLIFNQISQGKRRRKG